MPLKQPRNIKGYTYVCNYDPKRPDSNDDPYYKFIDDSGRDHTVIGSGAVQNVKDVSEIGNSSIYFYTATNDYLTVSDSEDFNFSTNDLTIDFWVRFNHVGIDQYIMTQYVGSSDMWWIKYDTSDPSIRLYSTDGVDIINCHIYNPGFVTNTWYHIVFERNGNYINYYQNGILSKTVDITGKSFVNPSTDLDIGRYTGTSYDLWGYLDEIRISKGIAQTTNPDDLLYIADSTSYVEVFSDLCNFNYDATWDDSGSTASAYILNSFLTPNIAYRLVSGAATGTAYASLANTQSVLPRKYSFEITLNHAALGTSANGDLFSIDLRHNDCRLLVQFATDGLYIRDSSSLVEVGTDLVAVDTWQTWKFNVDATIPASSTVDVYLNDSLIQAGVDCSYAAGGSNEIYLIQYGNTTANRTTYVYDIKLSHIDGFIPPSIQHEPDYDTDTDTGAVLLIHPEEDLLNDYYDVQGGDTWFDETLEYGKVYDDTIDRWIPIIDGKGFGYMAGGWVSPNVFSSIERMQFSLDNGVTNIVGNLSESKACASGFNSSNYGYNAGGAAGTLSTYNSTIEKFQFPFDSGNAVYIGNLTYSIGFSVGCNSSNYGFAMGGKISTTVKSHIHKIGFAFDIGASYNANRLAAQVFNGTSCNSSTSGYYMGGQQLNTSNDISSIQKFEFPLDTGNATRLSNLSSTISFGPSGFNSSNYGYTAGGYQTTGAVKTTLINRFAFPFDTGTAVVVGSITNSTNQNSCGTNSSIAGYINGGGTQSNIQKISFPFDSGITPIVGNLTAGKINMSGIDTTDFNGLF